MWILRTVALMLVLFATGAQASAVSVPWEAVTTPITRDTEGIVETFVYIPRYGYTTLHFEEASPGFGPISAFGFQDAVAPGSGPAFTDVVASYITYIEPVPGVRVGIATDEVARVSFRTDGLPMGSVPIGLAFDRPVNAIDITSYFGTSGWRVTPVPEPGGLPLLAAGLAVLALSITRKAPRAAGVKK